MLISEMFHLDLMLAADEVIRNEKKMDYYQATEWADKIDEQRMKVLSQFINSKDLITGEFRKRFIEILWSIPTDRIKLQELILDMSKEYDRELHDIVKGKLYPNCTDSGGGSSLSP